MMRSRILYPDARLSRRVGFRSLLALLFIAVISGRSTGDDKVSKKATGKTVVKTSVRPKVPGKFKLRLRSRRETAKGSGKIEAVVRDVDWKTSETAIIICDMWDNHYCQSAAQRVDQMAPRMNRVITSARNHGALIIHAPSGTMKFYSDASYRKRMQQAPYAKPAVPLKGWCYLDPSREAKMPVDTSRQPCDDPVVGAQVRRFSRQHAAIKIIGYDGISDNGQEIFNVFRQQGIKNVVLMGVHTNMCVLGRPFGIRQLVNLEFNVALARDLTDAMYDPREFPYVSHTRGTELVVEHIERYWCPSILGKDLTKVVPGSSGPNPEVLNRRARPAATSQK